MTKKILNTLSYYQYKVSSGRGASDWNRRDLQYYSSLCFPWIFWQVFNANIANFVEFRKSPLVESLLFCHFETCLLTGKMRIWSSEGNDTVIESFTSVMFFQIKQIFKQSPKESLITWTFLFEETSIFNSMFSFFSDLIKHW